MSTLGPAPSGRREGGSEQARAEGERAEVIALTTGDATGVRSIIERQANPTMDPRVAAQNRFRFRLTGNGGSWDIAATLTFADGTGDYRWRAEVDGPRS
jgi:hypothetical protein